MQTVISRALALAVLLAFSATAFAQMGTGRVNGSLKDSDGNPIEGATITASDGGGRTLEATTDKSGNWALMGFRKGTYEFTFAADGFAPQAYQAAINQTGRNPTMDVVLERAGGAAAAGGGGSLLGEANDLFAAGNYDEALAIYEQTLANDPSLYQVNLLIGNVHVQKKEFEEALQSFNTVLEFEPMNTDALIQIGNVYVEQQKFDESIPFFEKAIEGTTDEVVPFNVAEIYFSRGNSAKAIEFYQVAAERKPDWADPHLKLGYAHLGTGDMEAASASFQKVIEVAPDSQQAALAQQALDSLPK